LSTEHFVPADAIEGVKGSKPRFKSAREELPELTELADFPSRITDPEWMKTLEADGEGEGGKPRIRPASGQKIKAEQEKAKKRRKAKTETMRKLRAKG
jgi:hypothetical protein